MVCPEIIISVGLLGAQETMNNNKKGSKNFNAILAIYKLISTQYELNSYYVLGDLTLQ
ncbi:hypothetical protein GPAL_2353 [Glaciecola pallidula DSM 14239 = ACAM 615]|uniref:Uncharacterized protein n=1 Tax=Brumicola pallidula DSM 14239 = ACAM 615 TaxID=1121922 RepID=K6Y8Y6_9ALTE|nr:hypothetical protein GPAL_2353 [Glaciecola pallidula DSM 14239 = ACAM 615]